MQNHARPQNLGTKIRAKSAQKHRQKRNLFADILRLIAELRPPPATSTA
jgi:hypothetical protein